MDKTVESKTIAKFIARWSNISANIASVLAFWPVVMNFKDMNTSFAILTLFVLLYSEWVNLVKYYFSQREDSILRMKSKKEIFLNLVSSALSIPCIFALIACSVKLWSNEE